MTTSPYSKENLRIGILHFLLGRGLAGLAGFATVILLVRYMDVQSYAGYTALTGVIVLAGIIAGLGLERAISRYIPEGRLERSVADLGRFIWQMSFIRLAAVLIICLMIYFSWHLLPQLFQDVTIKEFPLSLACFILAETLFQHFSSILQALVMQKILTRIMVIQWAGRLLLILLFVHNHAAISLEDSLWIMAIPEMLGVVGFVIVLQQMLIKLSESQSPEQASHQLQTANWPNWRDVMQMSMNNYGFTLLAAPPQGYFMKMLAAAFLPTQMVAAYGFFLSIAERLRQYIPLHLLYNLIEPVMIASYLQDKNFKTLSYRSQLLYKSNLLLLIPVMALIVVAGPTIIGLLTVGKYQEYSWLLLIVIMQLTVGSHVVLLQLILNSISASRVLVNAGLWSLIVMAVATMLVSLIDIRALVLCPLVFSFTCNLYVLFQFKRMQLDYAFSWRMLIGAVSAGVIATVMSYFIVLELPLSYMQPVLQIVIAGFAVIFLYGIGLVLFKAIYSSEIDLVKSFFIRKSVVSSPSV